jgi:tRNA(Ile)-lysidine synthase
MQRVAALPHAQRGPSVLAGEGWGGGAGHSSQLLPARRASRGDLPLNGGGEKESAGARISLIRPFLTIPKSRLVATLKAAQIPFADDPTNRDPRFTRARLRGLMPRLKGEGLDASRLATLARRLARAEAALAGEAARAFDRLAVKQEKSGPIAIERAGFVALSPEIALRLLGRAIDETGDEGPVELGKLEALNATLTAASAKPKGRFRRSLAGALVTLDAGSITVERAPPRRSRTLTKGRARPGYARKSR